MINFFQRLRGLFSEFFIRQPRKDCNLLLTAVGDIEIPERLKSFFKSSYLTPSHKDNEVKNKIRRQVEILQNFFLAEVVYLLAKVGVDKTNKDFLGDNRIKIITKPIWADDKNFSRSSVIFTLNEKNYIAEQYSANYQSLVLLLRLEKNSIEPEIAFAAHRYPRTNTEDVIDVSASNMCLDEAKSLKTLALLLYLQEEKKSKHKIADLILRLEEENQEVIKKNFGSK